MAQINCEKEWNDRSWMNREKEECIFKKGYLCDPRYRDERVLEEVEFD